MLPSLAPADEKLLLTFADPNASVAIGNGLAAETLMVLLANAEFHGVLSIMPTLAFDPAKTIAPVETIVPSPMNTLATLTASLSRPPPFPRRSRMSPRAPWRSTCWSRSSIPV